MTRILLLVIGLVILSEGLGSWIFKVLKIEQRGFAAPIGFAVLLASLQLLYYPAQWLNLSFTWIIVASILILAFALVVTCLRFKETLHNLINWNTIIVIICAGLFLYAFSKCYIDLDFSDSATYLNYIAQNINIDKLNLFNPTNGLVGEEWDVLYLFQGYYHFGSFICWLVNVPYYLLGSTTYVANLVVSVWGLGLLYNIISSMLIINMVRYFKFRNHWLEFCLLVFSLFFTNFYYWKVAFAFYGNTYRGIFVAMLIYVIYRWIKEDNEQIKYLIPFIVGAGLACSSSYLFLSFEILYCLAAYLFKKEKNRSLFDMCTLIIPLVLYAASILSRSHMAVALGVVIAYAVFLYARYEKHVRKIIWRLEDFFFEKATLIFFIIIPAAFVVGSALVYFFMPNLEDMYWYSHYF